MDDSLQKRSGAGPLDQAILSHDHTDVHSYEKVREIPFDFERCLLSVIAESGRERVLITKGAPESVLARSTAYELVGHPGIQSPAGR